MKPRADLRTCGKCYRRYRVDKHAEHLASDEHALGIVEKLMADRMMDRAGTASRSIARAGFDIVRAPSRVVPGGGLEDGPWADARAVKVASRLTGFSISGDERARFIWCAVADPKLLDALEAVLLLNVQRSAEEWVRSVVKRGGR